MRIQEIVLSDHANHNKFAQYRALNGKPAALKALLSPAAQWTGLPLADNKGDIQEALDILDQGRSFMIDPRLTVTDAKIERAANKVRKDPLQFSVVNTTVTAQTPSTF